MRQSAFSIRPSAFARRAILMIGWIALCSPVLADHRIGDICRIKGQEENVLHGMGLVVGLRGTGDGDNRTTRNEQAEDEVGWRHVDDFAAAIRDGHRPNAEIEEGHRTVALIHLANAAIRVGRSLDFDPQAEQIVDDAEASQLMSRVYRHDGHWAILAGV